MQNNEASSNLQTFVASASQDELLAHVEKTWLLPTSEAQDSLRAIFASKFSMMSFIPYIDVQVQKPLATNFCLIFSLVSFAF